MKILRVNRKFVLLSIAVSLFGMQNVYFANLAAAEESPGRIMGKDSLGQNLVVPEKGIASDSPVMKTESFEGELPAYVSVSKGEISISNLRSQDGTCSLRWDWVPGDTLNFKTGPLGNINVWTGYGGYSRSAFSIRIYNETVGEGVLIFNWMSGDKVGASFDFPLIMRGWQNICYHYSYYSKLRKKNGGILAKTDHILVEAPKAGSGGTVYFDMIDFIKPVDFRRGREPVTQLWKPFDISKDCNDTEILAPPTKQETDAIETLSKAIASPGSQKVTEAEASAIGHEIREKYDLKRNDDGTVAGKTVPKLSSQISDDLLKIAKLWLSAGKSTDPKVKVQLEETYFLLDDFFRESGAVAQGSIVALSWYPGRPYGDACFIMREPLKRTGRLECVRNCLKYNWGYDNVFNLPVTRQRKEMDYFYIYTRYLLNIALMHDSPAEIVSNLRAFSKRFNIDIINQVEPDGSLYHHGAYNFSYACYAFPVLAHQINLLSATPFAVSRQAFDKVKIAAMGMRWFCNLKEAPIFMHGRHPGRMSLNPSQYLSLAEAGRKYNDGKLERELAAAYLRFVPKDAGKPMFTGEGIIPESAPQGNLAMNFAALMGHRRGEWLAVVRGYGKYYWAQESYAGANRHGLFLGNGYLDILASGNPINIVDSGCDVAHGWDWRNLDGTTTFYAPLAKIANGNGTLGERSDICFMGGLSHDGRNGIFVFPLHSNFQYSKSLPDGMKNNPKKFFTAKKTYFFFENRIVCLGNEISLPDSQYPVRTTLFQKYLKESSIPIAVDGKTITELQFKTELAADKPHTLMDIQDTGYYIPAGQKVSLIREHQKSRDGHDEKDTEGDYATAWIEHGVNPDNAGYEYVVFPKTTPEAMESFAKEMAKQSSVVSRQSSADKNQDQRPYEILQKDSKAHVVWDLDSKTTGYVIFDPSWVPSNTDNRLLITDNLLLQVDKPCLVMIEEKAGGAVLMSVCDPDVHPGEKGLFIPSKVTITLRGKWKLDGKYPDAGMEDKGDGTSVFSLLCHEGKSYSYLINE